MQKSDTPASINYNKEKRLQYHYVENDNSTGFNMHFRAINGITELNCSSKLLFAEIFSLTNQLGYCFAKTEYFMNALCLSSKKVQRCLAQLEKYGLIIRTRTYNKTTKTSQRYIYINMDLFEQAIYNKSTKEISDNSDVELDYNSEDEVLNEEQVRLQSRIKSLKNSLWQVTSPKDKKFSTNSIGENIIENNLPLFKNSLQISLNAK